jgi:hypothetical protein
MHGGRRKRVDMTSRGRRKGADTTSRGRGEEELKTKPHSWP